MMVLKTLAVLGPLHGYGVARRIEQVSKDLLRLNRGNRLRVASAPRARRWMQVRVGVSGNAGKARFYWSPGRAARLGRGDRELGADGEHCQARVLYAGRQASPMLGQRPLRVVWDDA